MDKKNERASKQDEQEPGSMSSYNNREENRQGKVEDVVEKKDEGQSYMDYNGNSEANAPARSRE